MAHAASQKRHRGPPVGGLDFTHERIRDVAYTQIVPPYRRFLHARVTAAIEALHPGELELQAAELGRHYWEAQVWGSAVVHLARAGAQAAARSAHRAAAAHFTRAIEAVGRLPDAPARATQAIDLRFDLRTSLVAIGEFGRILACLREAETLARELGDERRRGWVAVYMAHYYLMSGDLEPTEGRAQAARAIGEAVGDRTLAIAATHYHGWARLGRGDHAGAETCFRAVLEVLDRDPIQDRCGLTGYPAVMTRWLLSTSLADRGELAEAMERADEAIRIADALDHAFSRILSRWARAHALASCGAFEDAVREYERALAIARQFDISFLVPFVTAHLGHAHARAGRPEQGIALLDEALAVFDRSPYRIFHSLFVAHRAEAAVLAGRLDEARAWAARAVALARARGETSVAARVDLLLASAGRARRHP